MSSPMFPNTTNTRTWPYGTVKRVQVIDVITKPQASVAAIICGEILHASEIDFESPIGPEAFILMLKPELVGTTKKGDQGTITFRPGGPTLGYWDYQGVES